MALVALTPIRHDGVDYPAGATLPASVDAPARQALLDLEAVAVTPDPAPTPPPATPRGKG